MWPSRQPLLDCGKSRQGRRFARPDQIRGAAETIPFNPSYIEIDYQVAFFPPALLSPTVEYLETPVYDLEHVAGERPVTVGDVH